VQLSYTTIIDAARQRWIKTADELANPRLDHISASHRALPPTVAEPQRKTRYGTPRRLARRPIDAQEMATDDTRESADVADADISVQVPPSDTPSSASPHYQLRLAGPIHCTTDLGVATAHDRSCLEGCGKMCVRRRGMAACTCSRLLSTPIFSEQRFYAAQDAIDPFAGVTMRSTTEGPCRVA
jgi:hypothetical protein